MSTVGGEVVKPTEFLPLRYRAGALWNEGLRAYYSYTLLGQKCPYWPALKQANKTRVTCFCCDVACFRGNGSSFH